ncbi:anti-phage deoxyguanosine triphosphatase [Alteraurantiacibacter aquimixticola]|uniref:DNTP triphosphohydrolase n=1 Tax=Alteraurantiacibacter aquimixticola TaxID=2489173 RepID=A0A4T3F1V2_9SPHN|nr:anti-phage deoxyguanosine triphosphatase [Alteraurantiacibacter aquimixticola]TIX50265.1 dNTP triphosphohydrolase [Alteraurantiacibacter aquimixticola]
MVWLERKSGWEKKPMDARSPGDVDYARIIHSGSFRRLQGKTQILNLGDSDFYRTRLTHSLEVAQIAGGLGAQLRKNFPDHDAVGYIPDRSMMQAIACTHDLGHPPFGHGGEVALNYCMRENGGFEGNGQTLRILSKLEKFSDADGADLCRETLLGVLKYPVAYNVAANPAIVPRMLPETSGTPLLDRKASTPPKCYLDSERGVVSWLLDPLSAADRVAFQSFDLKHGKHAKARHKSFACSIMDLADDISFGIHDMEDALALCLVDQESFRRHVTPDKCQGLLDYLNSSYAGQYENDVYGGLVERMFSGGAERKHQINRILNFVITSVEISEIHEFEEPRLRYRAKLPDSVARFVEAVKQFIYEEVILSPSVQHLEFKGQMMVVAVFEVLKSDPKSFLPRDIYEKYKNSEDPMRDVCDYVAGMTDTYLLKAYERLFSPRIGSVFDKL